MTIRFNVVAGCESGVVKGIDTTNNGIYVVHKSPEAYSDPITHLEWAAGNGECDYMQVDRSRVQQPIAHVRPFTGVHCNGQEQRRSSQLRR